MSKLQALGFFAFLLIVYALSSIFAGMWLALRMGAFWASISVFVGGLIVCHGYFFVMKNEHNRNIPKYIDYAYLLLAAVGLFGALESDAEWAGRRARSKEPYLTNTFKDMQRYSELQALAACNPGQAEQYYSRNYTNKAVCEFLNDYRALIAKPAEERTWKSFIERSRARFSLEPPYFVEFLLWRMSDYLSTLLEKQQEEQQAARFDKSLLQLFAFFLLAAGLALRLTKVTVEIAEWHAGRPQPRQGAQPELPNINNQGCGTPGSVDPMR
jgi:hypothetical protein